MRLKPVDISPITRHGVTRLSSLPRLPLDDFQHASRQMAPWVCRRCYGRLTRATHKPDTSVQARKPLVPNLLRQSIQRTAYFPTSRRNASTEDSKSARDVPNPSSSLPSHTESLRSPVSHRFNHMMDNLQSSLFHATQHINTLTGYTGIESLKASIAAQETNLQNTRAALVSARTAYSAAIKQRSNSQREVNELLQRKHNWSPSDLERFTELYRSDHANELNENKAHEMLVKAEKAAEEAGAKLSESILARYHEEQIWSDKIRRMSTWGTWGLMGVNVLLFLVFQIGVEPWRRKRLVKGFEEKVQEALERERETKIASATGRDNEKEMENIVKVPLPVEAETEVQEMMGKTREETRVPNEELETIIDAVTENEVAAPVEEERHGGQEIGQVVSTTKGRTFDYLYLKEVIKDLFSDRQVNVRKWDLTALVLEGTVTGMAVAGLIAVLLRS
ncbi:MAG: hypothetical protein Q9182_000412 [Xanthomendoza sp. 2 TL-2023]